MILFLLVFFPLCYCKDTQAISLNKPLPQITLNLSDDSSAKQYLGIKNAETVLISRIPAKLILIEVFSLYCPICHKQAPVANKIYKYIHQNPELDKDVRIIGIGAGNNQKEVGVFRDTFRVQFPLFADQDFIIHKKLGEPRTPVTILATKNGKVLAIHQGVIEDVDGFLQSIKKIHGQQ
jgi:hypothetical protein